MIWDDPAFRLWDASWSTGTKRCRGRKYYKLL